MSSYFTMPMFRAGTTPWFYHDNFDMFVDFCIWVLEADGLHAAPFDSHAEGDGTLRTAGLDAGNWLSWMRNLISVSDRRRYNYYHQTLQKTNATWELLQAKENLPEDDPHKRAETFLEYQKQIFMEQLSDYVAKPFFPSDFWHGNKAVETRLGEMWELYGPVSNHRDIWGRERWKESQSGVCELLGPPENPSTLRRKISQEGSQKTQNLWNDLVPYHDRLDGLVIHFIEYPQQIDYLVPPLSAIITLTEEHCDYESVLPRVLQVAEALATHVFSESEER